ncbi:twin transmembrane helix small protein [Ampullimonas aquatilis]|uniref:twin transmembrane helix small protein n=1 Tax=Ampullimonas aquatilis TaxID=1341549 RepID=UPI003C720F95
MRIFIALAFTGILLSLGSALFFLMKDKGGTNRIVKALAFRVGLSILLFLIILFCYWMGWIQYTGIR